MRVSMLNAVMIRKLSNQILYPIKKIELALRRRPSLLFLVYN